MVRITRTEAVDRPRVIPEQDPAAPQRMSVDVAWGTLQPIELEGGVRTVGELEVIAHLEAGYPIVDSRTPSSATTTTLPGAVSIPHTEMEERQGELDPDRPTVLFCNGPQCGQSPNAIRALLAAGHRSELLLYYRGGLHDWMTLGLPTVTVPGSSD